jgi:hypothetical protein
MQDRDAIRKQNAQVQEPHASHFKLTQQALGQSGGRILNPLEITQVTQVGACLQSPAAVISASQGCGYRALAEGPCCVSKGTV